MTSPTNFSEISDRLINWYQLSKRNLPWRYTSDPYSIWISEIILQQTRVVQGTNYYHKFIDRFRTVSDLANADLDEVLKLWQGLGYYSRARNLHKAARQIVDLHNGIFPIHYDQILNLPGIGIYTASAICSIAFNQPFAVVDGNVYRVISRLFAIDIPIDSTEGKKIFQQFANQLLSIVHPGLHNQAMMEFGALHCTPLSPSCGKCPLTDKCMSFHEKKVELLPIKNKKTKINHRYFNYIFLKSTDFTYIQQRHKKDIWQNLYEFPMIETEYLLTREELYENTDFIATVDGIENIKNIFFSTPFKHILTHQIIHAQFICTVLNKEPDTKGSFTKVNITHLDQFPVSRLIELFLENNGDFLST